MEALFQLSTISVLFFSRLVSARVASARTSGSERAVNRCGFDFDLVKMD